MLAYSAALGIGIGVASALMSHGGIITGAAFLTVGLACAAAAFIKQRPLLFLLTVGFCAASFGVARAEIYFYTEATRNLSQFAGKERVVIGVVANDPEQREASLHAHIKVSSIDGEDAAGKVLAILPRETELNFGDTMRITGDITLPASFETDTGRLFNYSGYLQVRGISALMRFASVEEREEKGWSLRGMLYGIKHAFQKSLRSILPEPRAALMEGILIGERRGIPEKLNDAFIAAGLIHIIVLSGYNISIVAEQVLRFFSIFFPKKISLGVGAIAIILFAVMTGAGATTVRATTMGLIAMLARYLDRPGAALRALAVAAVFMVLWNPPALLFDPSFVLSVLATFGLITLSPSVERRLTLVPERFGLRSIIASTIAVQIYILPALLYMTGILSVFALPANALVLPFVPLVMLAGFVAGTVGLLHGGLALPFAIVADALLRFVVGIADLAASLPFSSATVSAFPVWVAMLFYLPLTFFAIVQYRRSGSRVHSSSDS